MGNFFGSWLQLSFWTLAAGSSLTFIIQRTWLKPGPSLHLNPDPGSRTYHLSRKIFLLNLHGMFINHYYLFKSLVSKYSHILRYGGLEFQFMNFEGTQIHSITPWILIFYLIASFCLRGWCSSYLQSQPEILFFSLLFCLSTLSLFVAVSVYICFYSERCFEVSLWAHGFSYIQCFY